MADYLAVADYGTPKGNERQWSGNVEAADMTAAHEAAYALLRHERKVARVFKMTIYPPVARGEIDRQLFADALAHADGFLQGFEDDEGQEGVVEALALIERAQRQLDAAGPADSVATARRCSAEEPGAPTREEVRDAATIATGGRLAPAALDALTAKVAATYVSPAAPFDYSEDIPYAGRKLSIYCACTGEWQYFIDDDCATSGFATKAAAKAMVDGSP